MNSSPYGTGIYKRGNRFTARVSHEGIVYYVGRFDTVEEATHARIEKLQQLQGKKIPKEKNTEFELKEDNFVIYRKEKYYGAKGITINIPIETYKGLENVKRFTDVPISRIVLEMIDFCLDRIEIRG